MVWLRRAGIGEVPAWASVSQVVDAHGLLRNCVLVLNDMTERMREEERIRYSPSVTRSPGCPTGACSTIDWSKRWRARAAATRDWRALHRPRSP
jgi:hypothetical protein